MKKYYRWSSFLSRNNGERRPVHSPSVSLLFYHSIRDVFVAEERVQSKPECLAHVDKSNFLLETTRAQWWGMVDRNLQFDTGEPSLSFSKRKISFSSSFFPLSLHTRSLVFPFSFSPFTVDSFVSFFFPSIIETTNSPSSLFIPWASRTRETRRAEKEARSTNYYATPQMGLFLLSLSARRRVSHPALLVARVPRIHTDGRCPFFLPIPVARFATGLRHAGRARRPKVQPGSNTG